MRSPSHTWPPVTDRYARMRKRAATVPNADELRAEFEQAWAELAADPQQRRLMLLPSTGQRPTRAERRRNRMREHTLSLLINALRSDGTMGSIIRVHTCKAFRVLPWDIGFPHASRVTDIAPDSGANAAAAAEDVAADMGIVAAGLSFLLPQGLEFAFEDAPEPFPPIDTESDLKPYDLSDLPLNELPGLAPPWPLRKPLRPALPARAPFVVSEQKWGHRRVVQVERGWPPTPWVEPPDFVEQHANPALIEPTAKGAPPPKRSSWHPSPVPREDLFLILAMALILAAVAALAITF